MTIPRPQVAPSPPNRSAPAGALRKSLRGIGQEAAELARFGWRTITELAAVRLYAAEVFRQAGVLILSSALVLWVMAFLLGAMLAVQAHYLFREIGAASYVGAIPAVFDTRGASETTWGWILAAKVGCGIVAEIGSMRISEEVDAMEVMGIRSRPYLVGTRLVAAIMATPFLYVVGYVLTIFGSYLMNVLVLHTVSQGGFLAVLWAMQNTTDFVFSILWTMIVSVVIILVSCFFGYTAKGGPVGVGTATAKSMLVNMVLISVLAMTIVQLLYGNNPNAPIAN